MFGLRLLKSNIAGRIYIEIFFGWWLIDVTRSRINWRFTSGDWGLWLLLFQFLLYNSFCNRFCCWSRDTSLWLWHVNLPWRSRFFLYFNWLVRRYWLFKLLIIFFSWWLVNISLLFLRWWIVEVWWLLVACLRFHFCQVFFWFFNIFLRILSIVNIRRFSDWIWPWRWTFLMLIYN